MTEIERLSTRIPETMAGRRLDQALSELFSRYSRSRLQQWIREGRVTVNGGELRAKDKVQGGELVEVRAAVEENAQWQAQAIPLVIVHEDPALLVINKPPGMVVHPAAGNRAGTLLNALLHHAPELAGIPRAGIVHRLDKDTSGLLVVARTLTAQKRLVEQLQARTLEREYDAVVVGVMTAGGSVDAPVGRHPVQRTRMAVTGGGKPALTHYRVVERYRAHTWIKARLETGRTHQIRVHMAHIRHPLVGDPVYGGRLRLPKKTEAAAGERLAATLRGFKRQALHAGRLGLMHPETGESMQWQAPLPDDMVELIECLREDAKAVSSS